MKIAIIDDHPLVRMGLFSVLSMQPDFECIGEAATLEEGIELLRDKQPDIALVDLRIGKKYGLDLVSDCKAQNFKGKFIIVTSSVEQQDFQRAKDLGVEGYVLKEAFPEEMLHAISIVARGRKYYDPGILELISTAKDQEDELVEKLTSREQEVLMALGKGLSNKEIAQRLYITEYTVKKHVSQILAKLNLADRTQAALYANSKGLASY